MVQRLKMILIALMLMCTLTACSGSNNKQAISDVENLISVIDLDSIESEAVIVARKTYDELDNDLKQGVSNYQTLIDAERICEEQHLEDILTSAHTTLYLNIAGCASLREVVVTVWGNSIDNKYADFNKALSSLYQGESYEALAEIPRVIVSEDTATNFVTALETLKSDDASLEKQMKEMSTLEIDEQIYEAFVSLYSQYVILYNQVLSPSGSYITYCSDTNESANKIVQAEALLDVVWPY